MSAKRLVQFCAAIVLLLTLPAAGRATPAAQPEVVTRVYSLRPLLAQAEEASDAHVVVGFQLQPGERQGVWTAKPAPGAGEAVEGTDSGAVVEQVIEMIRSTIEEPTWRDNGGEVGSIAFLPINARLVVTHTPEVHDRVAKLLEELQDRAVLSVRAKLVRLSEDQVEQRVRMSQGVALWQGELAGVPEIAQMRFSGFDDQAHSASDGRRVAYISEVQPIVAANAVGYQSIVSHLQTGLTLNVTSMLSADAASATIELHAEYVLLVEGPAAAATAPAGAGAPDAIRPEADVQADPGQVVQRKDVPILVHLVTARAGTAQGAPIDAVLPDRITVDRRMLETSLRLPTGQWVLVGTLSASRDGEAVQGEPLHLLIRIDAGGE